MGLGKTQGVSEPIGIDAAVISGLPIMLAGRRETTELIVGCVERGRRDTSRRPVLSTSINGHVIYELTRSEELRQVFESFPYISMDGQPAVILSRLWPKRFPERVATTDLVHDVFAAGIDRDVRHYFLGGKPGVAERAARKLEQMHKGATVVGARDGYFEGKPLSEIAAEIDEARPDIVWVCMGVPVEQSVARELAKLLKSASLIKTGGGLLDFLSGDKSRAPDWMQRMGFEWAYRLWLEPKRLLRRYMTSNVVALWKLISMRPSYRRL